MAPKSLFLDLIYQDFSRFIQTSQHYWDFLRYFKLKNMDKLRNLDCEMWSNWQTLDRGRDKLSRFAKKFHVSTDFSIETYGTGRSCRDKIEISQSSRLSFWECQDFLDCWDLLSSSVEIETLDRDKLRPPGLLETFWCLSILKKNFENVATLLTLLVCYILGEKFDRGHLPVSHRGRGRGGQLHGRDWRPSHQDRSQEEG